MTDLDIITYAQEGQFNTLTTIFNTNNHQISEYIIRNALFWATRNGHTKIVELLLLNGANIGFIYNQSQYNRYQIMNIAVSSGDIETVNILIKYKADINYLNPLHTAIKFGNIELVKHLISIKADIEPNCNVITSGLLYNPIRYNDLDILQLLIQSKVNINHQYPTAMHAYFRPIQHATMTYLELAAQYSNFNCVKLLLEYKSVIDSKALLATCRNGNIDIARLLINTKTNVNTYNNDLNYIFKAAENNHPRIIELLINAGCIMNSFIGYQALLGACDKNRLSVVKTLISTKISIHGILNNPNITNQIYRYPEITEYIKSILTVR